jgi:hypothetical protein
MPRKTPPTSLTPPTSPTSATLLHGGDKGISAPQKVTHEMHVDRKFNWTGKQVEDVFEVIQELGRGSFGIVYKARVCTCLLMLVLFYLCVCKV